MIVVIGASGDTPPATTFRRKSVSVTMPNPPASETQSSRDALCAHQTGGFLDCSFWTAEHRRRCYELADADRANLRQAVDGVTGAGKPLTHGSGDEYGSVRPAKYVQRLPPLDCVAGGVVMRPDVNAAAIPVSSDGCPKLSPGSRMSTTSSWWRSSTEPLRMTKSSSAGGPSSIRMSVPAG